MCRGRRGIWELAKSGADCPKLCTSSGRGVMLSDILDLDTE